MDNIVNSDNSDKSNTLSTATTVTTATVTTAITVTRTTILTIGKTATTVACERQMFLLAHRPWGNSHTNRELKNHDEVHDDDVC